MLTAQSVVESAEFATPRRELRKGFDMRVIALLFILILPALALKEIVARWQNDIDHSVKLQALEGKPDWVLSFYDGEDLVELDLGPHRG